MISDKEKALLKLIENEPLALDEFKSIQKEVLELLNEKNPYAIYCSVSFPNIIWNGTDPSQLPYREINALKSKVKYEKGNIKIKNEKEIFDYYGELCKNQKNTEELKAKIWNCLPPKVLAVIKKYHEQNGKKESLTTSERSFHNEASDILAKRINELSNLEKEIKAKKNNAGKEELYQLLTGKEWSESIRENIHKMLIADPKTSFSEEFAKKVFENCGNKDSLVLYCEELLDSNNINPLIVSDFFSSGLAEEASGIAKRMFNALPIEVQPAVYDSISSLPVAEICFGEYVRKEPNSNNILKTLDLFLSKHFLQEDAILSCAETLKDSNDFGKYKVIIESYAKNWMLLFNKHNQQEYIDDVVEALHITDSLSSMTEDFSFWKQLKNNNAFLRIIKSFAKAYDYQSVYQTIESNILACQAYEQELLASKWIEAAYYIADDKDAYIQFLNSMLNNRTLSEYFKQLLIINTEKGLLQENINNKSRLEKEKEATQRAKEDVIYDLAKSISDPLTQLEKVIFNASQKAAENKDIKGIKLLYSGLRRKLENIGIHPAISVDDWNEGKTLQYNPKKHNCTDNPQTNDDVVGMSMGLITEGNEPILIQAYVKKV